MANDVPPKASNFSPPSHHSSSTTFLHLVLQNDLGLVRISLVQFSWRRHHRMLPWRKKNTSKHHMFPSTHKQVLEPKASVWNAIYMQAIFISAFALRGVTPNGDVAR
jgi:hypothetical protein